MSQEIALQKELAPIVDSALSLTVKRPTDMPIATELLSRLNTINDRIEEEKQKVLGPLNEARTAEINRWKPAIKAYEAAITYVRTQIGNYQTEQEKIKRAKEAKIAEKLSKGEIDLEQAMTKIDKVKAPTASVTTASGSISFREDKVLKIIDISKIPDEYWIVDEEKVMTDLLEGKEINGAEIDLVMVPINRRK